MSRAWARVSGRFDIQSSSAWGQGFWRDGTKESGFTDLGLRLDDVQDLVFQNHANQHFALLLVAVLDPKLGDVLDGLLGEFLQPLFELGVSDLNALGLG